MLWGTFFYDGYNATNTAGIDSHFCVEQIPDQYNASTVSLTPTPNPSFLSPRPYGWSGFSSWYVKDLGMLVFVPYFLLDAAAFHLPNVSNMEGLLNLLSVCVLVIMGNVLDFRTYRAPSQKDDIQATKDERLLIDQHDFNSIPLNEREAICYARGVALHVMDWIRFCCTIKSPDGSIVQDFPSKFLVQIANSLLEYKERAEKCALDGPPHCKLKLLRSQVLNMIKCDHYLHQMWLKKDTLPSNSLELADKNEYTVEWQKGWEARWRSLEKGSSLLFTDVLQCLMICANLSRFSRGRKDTV